MDPAYIITMTSKQLSGYKEKEKSDEFETFMNTNVYGEGSDIICRKCKNQTVRHYSVQTRSADEPSTEFYKCKCGHEWREN